MAVAGRGEVLVFEHGQIAATEELPAISIVFTPVLCKRAGT
jgi:hypothetical protein